MTPFQTSCTCSGLTNAPSRWANIGLVDRPPPTKTSYPVSPCSLTTPTNAMSLISWTVQCAVQPDIADLNFLGRFENSGVPM